MCSAFSFVLFSYNFCQLRFLFKRPSNRPQRPCSFACPPFVAKKNMIYARQRKEKNGRVAKNFLTPPRSGDSPPGAPPAKTGLSIQRKQPGVRLTIANSNPQSSIFDPGLARSRVSQKSASRMDRGAARFGVKPLILEARSDVVAGAGIEPATQGFSVLCSTN